MPEPARGTRAQLGDLMEAVEGIEELIEALGSRPTGPPSRTQR
jgi:hypothetical protein